VRAGDATVGSNEARVDEVGGAHEPGWFVDECIVKISTRGAMVSLGLSWSSWLLLPSIPPLWYYTLVGVRFEVRGSVNTYRDWAYGCQRLQGAAALRGVVVIRPP